MKKFFTILFFLQSLVIVSQPVKTDSLKLVLQKETDPAKKAALLIQYCESFRYSDPPTMHFSATQLKELGSKSKNRGWEHTGDYYIGVYYNLIGKPGESLAISLTNINALKNGTGEEKLLSQFYSLAGNCLMKLNRQREALEMFYSSLKSGESNNDEEAQFKASNNIGWAFMELNQFDNAIPNFKNALHLIHENNLPDRYGTIYNNLASCYGSLNQFDSTYKYANIGIAVAEKYNDYAALANGYNILGTFLTKEKKYTEALGYFEKAKPIREKAGDPFFIVSDMAEIADLQAKLGKTDEGIQNSKQALAIAERNKLDAKLPLIYTALAHNYEAAGNFQEAAVVYKKLNDLKDSLYKDANPKALAEIQTKYETEKKQRLIEKQQFRISRQNYIIAGIAVLLLLGGWLGYSLYRRYQLNQKTKMQAALMKQQQEATKAVMEAEENERQRIAKDLHDGVGQIMSAAKMNLSAFESNIKFENKEQQLSFEKIIALVDESCKEVRSVSHNMMPNALLKNSLAEAVREFIDKIDRKTIQIHLYTEGLDERLNSSVETVLYRVIQECVNNVIKHSGANSLDISLVKDKEGISATVEDNGKGFDATDKVQFDGIGLKNIITRIEYLKGTVDFDSAPGRGTVVALYVPVDGMRT